MQHHQDKKQRQKLSLEISSDEWQKISTRGLHYVFRQRWKGTGVRGLETAQKAPAKGYPPANQGEPANPAGLCGKRPQEMAWLINCAQNEWVSLIELSLWWSSRRRTRSSSRRTGSSGRCRRAPHARWIYTSPSRRASWLCGYTATRCHTQCPPWTSAASRTAHTQNRKLFSELGELFRNYVDLCGSSEQSIGLGVHISHENE